MLKLRNAALKYLPDGAVRFVRDYKTRWRDKRAIEAFAAVPDGEPLVMHCIGARGGVDGLADYLHRAGKLRLVGFEPDESEASRLAKARAFDVVAPYGLGNVSESRILNLTRNRGCSSLREPHQENLARFCAVPDWFTVEGQTPVRLMRLDEAVAADALPRPEILEIDTQGFDFEVLEGCGALLDGVYTLATELQFYPLYHGQKTVAEVIDWLAARGFALAFMRRNGYYGRSIVEVNACFYNQRLVESSPRGLAAFEFWRAKYGAGA